MLSITKEFTFDAAHHLVLPHLSSEENRALYGPCAMVHGHTYKLQVTISGTCDQSGMVINFCTLKKLVKDHILDRYDHADLNTLPEYQEIPPTAENMALFIFQTLASVLNSERYQLQEIRVYETPNAWAKVTADA
ncbi:6-carboxytetrahydropterin synthase [Desulfogranum japonicum]|uniref:6-carboxytetrahydropterin synthase n=1 Tax=Desulfogranum japonicum TaxID=231447 RepID=UPI00041A743F|nr:6-carboxytetrahydropterin synthase [Desulfogranum japonicum]